MPTIQFPLLFALASRSARTILTQGGAPDMAVTTEARTSWYRYVSYRGNMPQVNEAGRTQFLTLSGDIKNRWTGSDLEGGGRQGLYFSAEFLDRDDPFPEVSHYQQGDPDSNDLVPYYEYHPGAEQPIDPTLQVERSTNLRSMFLFTLTEDRSGLDLRLRPNGHDPNPLLTAIHEEMLADPDFEAARAQAEAGGVDANDLGAMYRHGDSADFCRAVGNAALEQPGVDHLLVTSARDGASTNIVAQTEPRIGDDPPVRVDHLQPEGRATFFVNADGHVGQGVFSVSDLLYNASFESPTSPPPELPEVEAVKQRLLEAQQASIDELGNQLVQELAVRPATPAMDAVVGAITVVQDRIADGDFAGTTAAIEQLEVSVTAAAQDPPTVGEFKAALNLSSGVAHSLSTMADAIQAAQDRIDGLDPEPPDAIHEPDPEALEPDLPEPPPVEH